MEQIYKNIKARRLELKMSQEELAQLCGYKGRSMICRVEKGEIDLPYEKIYAFAKALKMEPEDLMGWDEAEHSEENAHALGSVIHDAKLMDHVKKMLAMDDTKKEAVYSYTDFLLSNN